MRAEIIAIGDEILYGITANTNTEYISKLLVENGIITQWTTVVGDKTEDIVKALQQSIKRSDIVITTGGLGPTHDDVTKQAVTQFLHSELVLDQRVLDHIRKRFQARGVPFARANQEQAMVPAAAEVIYNSVGTAPGLYFMYEKTNVFITPGVPHEMQHIMTNYIVPKLKNFEAKKFIKQRMLKTTGIPESTLFEKMDNIEEIEKYANLAFLPSSLGVNIRLTATGESENIVLNKLSEAETLVRKNTRNFIYGIDSQSMESVVADLLKNSAKTIAVAESCTGGLLAHKLTNISGSSHYFERGVVTYSNKAKQTLLGVPEALLIEYGAVSSQTAVAMAEGIRSLASVDIGISTTGIAGPTGGTAQKPVGLVYIGFADENHSYSFKYNFPFTRIMNKQRTVMTALDILRRYLSGLEMQEKY